MSEVPEPELELRGQHLHFDCFSGVAGDMVLAALLDLGVDEAFVRGELAKLPLATGYRLERTRVKRGALTGAKIHVHIDEEPHHHHAHDHPHDHDHQAHHAHRHYREIRALIVAHLDGDVRARSLAIFDRIAAVEAALHGTTVEDVAFHEVGAVDSIVDIVGAAAALAWLSPSGISCRPVPLGGGSVDTAHGRLPVPAPASLALLVGIPVEAGGTTELTTPTGAAIVAASATSFGDLPAMTVTRVGWGAGDRELADRPNLLRLVLGRPTRASALASDEVLVIEANLDDMNPEWYAPLSERLFAAGALDVWVAPIVMKKGRPAHTLSVLAPPALGEALTGVVLRHSSTLGVRMRRESRRLLQRVLRSVETPYGPIRIKVGSATESGDVWNAAPEHDDCAAAALAHDVPVKDVYQAALVAWAAFSRGSSLL